MILHQDTAHNKINQAITVGYLIYKNNNPAVIGSNLLYNINLNVKLNKLE